MLEAVFISDLHLNPEEPAIFTRFQAFLKWAVRHTRTVYILGDFLHVWAGDDDTSPWSVLIVEQLATLAQKGVKLYFMPGNRDFLIGQAFLTQAKMQALVDPTVITLDHTPVLLTHGDALCTHDKAHQRWRRLTRHPWFARLFLKCPRTWRRACVRTVRQRSQHYGHLKQSDVVVSTLLQMMQRYHVRVLIHGHTHRPGVQEHLAHQKQTAFYRQYVLSDWDDAPHILCYDKTEGFYFHLFNEEHLHAIT